MRYTNTRDPFKDRQPKMTFAEELALPMHTRRPDNWSSVPPTEGEISVEHVSFKAEYIDPLLETAYRDFENFAEVYGIDISNGGVEVVVRRAPSECFEAYNITVEATRVEITANDTEGIRRAIYYIEDEMKRREGARLPIGAISRKPFIKKRISRCYFSPASHAAVEATENELLDYVDYYPDEYLNRLAHDGVNALWLGASIKYLVKSDVIPEYGADAEQRMKKLNSVIEKCKRYGIDTYLFSVDPASDYCNEALRMHDDMMGEEPLSWVRHICPSVDKTVEYIKEAYHRVFTEAPGLAGYINLSVGESESHCGSDCVLRCERCKKKFGTLGATLAFVEKTICDAIHDVSPDAEYVSWTYAQRLWSDSDLRESARKRDTGVRHLVNFEDLGMEEQLGRKRLAFDYWISYVGPGELFKKCIEYDRESGVKTYAKIQTCSSHEISTVPYIITPGLLYEKYKYMHSAGVEGVMQCWFFGNYPCLMNKAAGELSFEPFFDKREDFLAHLGGIYWGKDGRLAAEAYEKFAEGYRNFPIGVSFEWYSPMQDSPCAPYHLEPIDLPMPSTWLVDDMVGSDRVCDSLLDSHTLGEAIELCDRMSRAWNDGLELIGSIDTSVHPEGVEQVTVAEATGLIFRSGLNTMRFYDMRNKLALGHEDGYGLLEEMRHLVLDEIEISERLIPITEQDNRIGYHSEAHGYKIFPEKLRWRIDEMKKLLNSEFVTVEERLKKGETPLPYYYGEENGARSYGITSPSIENAVWMNLLDENGEETDLARIRCSYNAEGYTLELDLDESVEYVRIDPEFKMFHRTSPLHLKNGTLKLKESSGYSLFSEHLEYKQSLFTTSYKEANGRKSYRISFPCDGLEMRKGDPFRMMIGAYKNGARVAVMASDERMFERLVLGKFSPDAFAFFVPIRN